MTRYLNRFSRDYRYIRKVLTKEKKLLKVHKLVPIVNRLINNFVNYPLFVFFIFIFFLQAKPDLQMGMRLGMNQMWQPMNFLKKE